MRRGVLFTVLTISKMRALKIRLGDCGMEVLGAFLPEANEIEFLRHKDKSIAGVVVASAGQQMWHYFRSSQMYRDGLPDPMNRWSKNILDGIAIEFDAGLCLPFDKPYPPLQSWVMRIEFGATNLRQSPLGLLIHPLYGLWFGLRGVLFFEVNAENQELDKMIQVLPASGHACDICVDKPCLSACPVKAFSNDGLSVSTCFSHLGATAVSNIEPDCMKFGCNARNACPVGVQYKYSDAQLQFHMDSYHFRKPD